MSSLADIQANIRRARADLAASLEPEALRAGADTAALVENRIVTSGRTAEGGRLSAYSEKQVPAYLYFGRSRTGGGESRVRAKSRQREPISYREFRQLNGLNTGHKNLEFTGEMWQGFGVTGVRLVSPGVVEVTIGGKNSRTTALLGYHSERENTQITKPSAQESRQIQASIKARLAAILDRYV